MRFPGLEGRVAIVTGHRGGIGSAIADVLRDSGATVIGLDLPDCDLAQPTRLRSCVDEVLRRHPAVDILVNNAGTTSLGSILDTPLEEVDRIFAVNFKAPFALIQAVLPSMIEQRRGSIVNVASDQAIIGKRFSAAYGASKAALAQLTRSAALDWALYNIRFNCIAPGSTDTPMLRTVVEELQRRYPEAAPADFDTVYRNAVPLGRLAQPVEIARVVAFLASDASSFMTGAIVSADGGETAR